MNQAYDSNGNEVYPVRINTICPIAYAALAKQIAVDYMHSTGATDDQLLDMLPDNLAPIGTGIPTHVFCGRSSYTHDLQNQLDYLAAQNQIWICSDNHTIDDFTSTHIKSYFCTIEGDTAALLDFLGLEVI